MASYSWKGIPTAISGGVDISDVLGCHLLWHMSSQCGSKRLLQGLVSHELTAYLSIFNPFLNQWVMVILSKECNPHNSLNLSFTNIRGLLSFVLNITFSLNQTPLTFLLYVRQTWMTQLILAIYLWGVIFLQFEKILLLICMVLKFMWKKDFLFHGTYI